jgi:magnesium transporter
MLSAYVFDESGFRSVPTGEACAELVGKPNTMVWFDAQGSSPEIEKLLRETLHLHPLTVEDIFEDRPTPKIEDYGNYLYVIVHGVEGGTLDLRPAELDIVLGKDWLFTHHMRPMASVTNVAEHLERNPKQLQRGPAWVAHALLDQLTDTYLPILDQFEEDVDDLEKEVVQQPDPKILPRLFALKRSLQRLRRISVYQRDMLQRLSRGEYEVLPEKVLPFYRDVFDHFVRIADFADSYRELVTAALDIYMSVIANRTNDVMKALTLISTIMLPLNFLAGYYGMNVNLPGQQWPGAIFVISVVMAVTAGAVYLSFRRRRWL